MNSIDKVLKRKIKEAIDEIKDAMDRLNNLLN